MARKRQNKNKRGTKRKRSQRRRNRSQNKRAVTVSKRARKIQKQPPLFASLVPLRKNQITIPRSGTMHEQLVRVNVSRSLGFVPTTAKDIVTSLKQSMVQSKTYSPDVNRILMSIRTDIKPKDMFGCGLENVIIKGKNIFNKRLTTVKVGENANKKPICKKWDHPESIALMLENLRSKRACDPTIVVTPKQIESNCWFNTFFVVFFLSDKGRKFFRYFREIMIRGYQPGKPRKISQELHHAFFFLNACIEAAYNNKNVALAMNTNHVIMKIYDAIPERDKTNDIPDLDEAGNPLFYYKAIMDHIGDSSIRYRLMRSFDIPNHSPGDENIEMYMIELLFGNQNHIPNSFEVCGNQYKLDSTVVMDIDEIHFCATLTCGDTEMAFDGASYSRLEPFKWKKLLNVDHDWTFEGSIFDDNKLDKIWWNFRKSYVLLFYYRI